MQRSTNTELLAQTAINRFIFSPVAAATSLPLTALACIRYDPGKDERNQRRPMTDHGHSASMATIQACEAAIVRVRAAISCWLCRAARLTHSRGDTDSV